MSSWNTNIHFGNKKQKNTTKGRVKEAIIAHLQDASRPQGKNSFSLIFLSKNVSLIILQNAALGRL